MLLMSKGKKEEQEEEGGSRGRGRRRTRGRKRLEERKQCLDFNDFVFVLTSREKLRDEEEGRRESSLSWW
jgi:hypothetical protein